MAISKVVYKSSPSATAEIWMDATSATAGAGDITAPMTAMLANGVMTTGTGTGTGAESQWELITDVTTTENLAEVAITTDDNGEPFALSEMFTRVKLPQPLTGANDYVKGQTYAKMSNGANPGWNSLSTLRYTSGTSSAAFEYHHEILAGICRLTVRNASSEGNTQNLQSLSFPNMTETAQVESINGIKLQQYTSSTTLIPSGTRIKIYGRRK